MKKLLLLLMMFPLMAVAQRKGVLVTHTDGSTTFLPMEKGQEILAQITDDKTLKFSGQGIGNIEITASEVLSFKIADETLGITNPKSEYVEMKISGDDITLAGLLAGTKVTMLNVNGMLVSSSVADAKGRISIDLRHLGSGIYVVRVANSKSYLLDDSSYYPTSHYGFFVDYDGYGGAGPAKPQVILVDRQGHVVFQSCLSYNYWDVRPVLENLFANPDDYYTSTDYTKDGEVLQLQSATVDKGIDLVFVGEGFVDKDMESGGKYEQKMIESMEQFFSQQPYESLRSRFNVYAVKAVSPNEVFTKESEHAIDKSDTKAFEYAKKAVGNNPDRMMVGVVYNTDYAVDRSYTVMYESDNSFVAYMMDGVSKVLNHEMGGHGIAFLLDEYVESGMEDQSPSEEDKAALDVAFTHYGEGANVDWRSNPSEVKWAHFLNDSRYNDEGLGVYEGAWLYGHGAYRPSENSMMRYNDCGFNAPSREAIYKRVMKLSEGDSWTYDYEKFVKFDTPARERYRQQQNAARRAQGQSTPKTRIESRPPTIYKGTWRDAGKYEKREIPFSNIR